MIPSSPTISAALVGVFPRRIVVTVVTRKNRSRLNIPPRTESPWPKPIGIVISWSISSIASITATPPIPTRTSPAICLYFYEKGNKRKHVSPDVFVVFGVAKKQRPNYLLWAEKKSPSFIMETTSSSTKKEDKTTKFVLYRDVLKVDEYFLFDPFGDYLHPQLKGYRLVAGDYVPIEPVNGRLPSEILGLHLWKVRGRRLALLWAPIAK